jgi:DUF4097 and DUF4098 domain-containing protein YvlB
MLRRWALVLLVLVPLCYAKDKYSETKAQEWNIADGAKLDVQLRFGDLHVISTDDAHLSIRYTTHSTHADFSRKVQARFLVTPNSATLKLTAPRDGSVDVELRVPSRSDLHVRVSAGDVSIDPVQGSLDVETHAGDIRIRLPEHVDLGVLDASTHAGDVNAPFGKPHGWIGGKLDYDGGGKYRIHAHTFAGDIDFEETALNRADSGPGLN